MNTMRRFASVTWVSTNSLSSAAAASIFSLRCLSYHKDYFGLLGVPRDVNVDLDALKKNYHAFQSEHHPDLHPSTSASENAASSSSSSSSSAAEVNLKDATAYAANAYSCIKDPFLRCRYLRLLLEADAKAVIAGKKDALPTGLQYYKLIVSHDATEEGKKQGGGDAVSEAVRADDHQANPVNHDQEFLMEMMELNMRLAEALEYGSDDPARKKELDALKATIAELEVGYVAKCEELYARIVKLQNELLSAEGGNGGVAADVFTAAKNQFRDTVLKWTFASNLRRQINEAY